MSTTLDQAKADTFATLMLGEGLGAMWGEEQARRLLAEAGFPHVGVKRLPYDFQHSYFIVR